MITLFRQYKSLQFILLLVIFYLLNHFIAPSDNNLLWRLPAALSWFPLYINDSISYLMFEWWPIDVYDPDIEEFEEKPVVREITRVLSGFILFLIEFIRELMLGGVKTIVTFSSWDWATANPWAKWPGLPWTVVAGGATILGYALAGRGLALLVGLSMSYISLFGQWEPAMQTLSFVLIAAPTSVFIGLMFGIWAFKSKTVETILNPLLNMAQIIPHFSYLIPVMVFFGIGDHAGAIATVIFATPPMVRLTLLGLKKLGPEVAESGMMSGCTSFQLLTKVLVPTARRDILIGVNQVIMQCLAMVVLASLIGAKGLGIDLLIALNGLKIGAATEIGICIVLIAIVLDRLSLAWANTQVDYFTDLSFVEKHKHSLMFLAVFIIGIALAYLGQFIFPEGFNYLYIVPHNKGISIAIFLQSGVDWIWDTFFFALKGFNEWLIISVLMKVKGAFLGMPVIATFTLVMGVGFIVGGIRVALTVGAFLLFIALTPWWDRALITAYLMSVSVLVSGIIGITLGTLCAQNAKSTRFILTYCDTFQTFPSFIYLIPVMMLFGITDTAVVIAIIVYASIPALRYTVEGLLSVPQTLQDAGTMAGVNRAQRWLTIELPMSFPHIALGINQTVVFALSMVIIGAMIGTDDLGQLILGSLSDRNGVGNGLILGVCVACIGLAIDQILRTWANQRKLALGLN
ncbi:ABC transporter permease subunit [Oceanospirillaceae bacterium]|jgi:glycine betaine/proline transport system permease protein|nr:ABC transporter permease subunit [Oceanospirillaceae bacterium]|tara:strand:- start:7030 stop:9090 length:2061 start_codon:yes stop_codon:yes gene_type:complete